MPDIHRLTVTQIAILLERFTQLTSADIYVSHEMKNKHDDLEGLKPFLKEEARDGGGATSGQQKQTAVAASSSSSSSSLPIFHLRHLTLHLSSKTKEVYLNGYSTALLQIAKLPQCTSLTSLTLSHLTLPMNLSALAHLTNLTKLELIYASTVATIHTAEMKSQCSKQMRVIASLVSVRHLTILPRQVADEYAGLMQYFSIEHPHLFSFTGASDTLTALDPRTLWKLMPSLQQLPYRNDPYQFGLVTRSEIISSFSKFPHLTHMTLKDSDLTFSAEKYLTVFSALPSLTSIIFLLTSTSDHVSARSFESFLNSTTAPILSQQIRRFELHWRYNNHGALNQRDAALKRLACLTQCQSFILTGYYPFEHSFIISILNDRDALPHISYVWIGRLKDYELNITEQQNNNNTFIYDQAKGKNVDLFLRGYEERKRRREIHLTTTFSSSSTPPASRLVGIELNPGPTMAPTAQTLFTDGLHSIFAFLTLKEWLISNRVCHSWLKVCRSTPTSRQQIRAANNFRHKEAELVEIATSWLRLYVISISVNTNEDSLTNNESATATSTVNVNTISILNAYRISLLPSFPSLTSLQLELSLEVDCSSFSSLTSLRELIITDYVKLDDLTILKYANKLSHESQQQFRALRAQAKCMSLIPHLESISLKNWRVWVELIARRSSSLPETLVDQIQFPMSCALLNGGTTTSINSDLVRVFPGTREVSVDVHTQGKSDFESITQMSRLTRIDILNQESMRLYDETRVDLLNLICRCSKTVQRITFNDSVICASSERWEGLFTHLPQLTHLILTMSDDPHLLTHLTQSSQCCAQLEKLELAGTTLLGESFSLLGSFTALHSLTICDYFPFRAFINLTFSTMKDTLDNHLFIPTLKHISLRVASDPEAWDWNEFIYIAGRDQNYRCKPKQHGGNNDQATPPASRLVGIELNPGPTTVTTSSSSSSSSSTRMNAQNLFTDGLHSIFTFLSNREWLRSSRTCHSWYTAAISTRPLRSLIHIDCPTLLAISSPLFHHVTTLHFRGEGTCKEFRGVMMVHQIQLPNILIIEAGHDILSTWNLKDLNQICPRLTTLNTKSFQSFAHFSIFPHLTSIQINTLLRPIEVNDSIELLISGLVACTKLKFLSGDFKFPSHHEWISLFTRCPNLSGLIDCYPFPIDFFSRILSSHELSILLQSRLTHLSLRLSHSYWDLSYIDRNPGSLIRTDSFLIIDHFLLKCSHLIVLEFPSLNGMFHHVTDDEIKTRFDDVNILPELRRFVLNKFIWDRDTGKNTNEFRRLVVRKEAKMKEVRDVDIPSPRLVGIELNPGPTSNNNNMSINSNAITAQHLFSDGLHSIISFLTRNEWVTSTCVNHHWLSACASSPQRETFIMSHANNEILPHLRLASKSALRRHLSIISIGANLSGVTMAKDECIKMFTSIVQLLTSFPTLRILTFHSLPLEVDLSPLLTLDRLEYLTLLKQLTPDQLASMELASESAASSNEFLNSKDVEYRHQIDLLRTQVRTLTRLSHLIRLEIDGSGGVFRQSSSVTAWMKLVTAAAAGGEGESDDGNTKIQFPLSVQLIKQLTLLQTNEGYELLWQLFPGQRELILTNNSHLIDRLVVAKKFTRLESLMLRGTGTPVTPKSVVSLDQAVLDQFLQFNSKLTELHFVTAVFNSIEQWQLLFSHFRSLTSLEFSYTHHQPEFDRSLESHR